MTKTLLSLNFMYCMERFATQIYHTQRGAFTDGRAYQQLTDASENERAHVQKLKTQIHKLNGRVYPLGGLFQMAGIILGLLTRLCGKRCLFGADVFVETRAVKDYNGFLNTVPFDSDTVVLIKGIIVDEEQHVINWKKARQSLDTTPPRAA